MKADQVLVQEKAAFRKVEPPCPYFGTCGGCTLQDLAYQDQLTLKRERLQRALASLGAAPGILELEMVGLEDPWRYRNKAEFTFAQVEGRMVLGYHAARSFWRIIDLEDCLLLPEPVTRVLRDVLALAASTGLPAYHPRSHHGFFRYLLVRHSRATERLLVCLMTTSHPSGGSGKEGEGAREMIERIAEALLEKHPAIASFYWGVTDRLADVALPEQLVLLRGNPHLEEQLGPFRLRLHPMSFLQPTSLQADRMYAALCRHLSGEHGTAWDLYCGMGLIAFHLSRQFRKVYGIDVEPHHLELAALNASLNQLTNIEFRIGRVETLLLDRRFWLQEAKPDVIVVDPPRAGLHPQALASVLAARPRRIGYLSCNVQSLARDLQGFVSGFPRYRLAAVQAFDMFPQTNHMEVLAILDRPN